MKIEQLERYMREYTREWSVDAKKLVDGGDAGAWEPMHFLDTNDRPVPHWVVAKATALAAHAFLRSNLIRFVEGL